MALFLNGLPLVTMELKSSLTGQVVTDAEKQYRIDRDSREPLFQFRRCLVHFAVGVEKVSMTTLLQGNETRFFPFNKGIENPVNPNGPKVSYLWEDILQPDNLMELMDNFIHEQEVTEKVYEPEICPRNVNGFVKERVTMPYTNHTSKEVELRGEAIYRREIRDKVELNHKDKF